jgi:hypothetical protein
LDPSDRARTLSLARTLAAALAVGPLLFLAGALLVRPRAASSVLVVPAGVLGLVAPAIGWRLQARLGEGARGGAGGGRRAYLRSLTAGLAVTEGAALLAVVAWFLSDELAALVGLPMHLLLVFALWPTDERLQRAEEEAAP